MSMPATLTSKGRRPETVLPDTGCRLAPRCRDCWLAECWYVMAHDQRQQLKDALAAIRPFVRAPDRALTD
jgi:hypothetical protein